MERKTDPLYEYPLEYIEWEQGWSVAGVGGR